LARKQCTFSENVLKLTYENVWVKNKFVIGFRQLPPPTIPVSVTAQPKYKYKYKYVISTAPLTPVVTSDALTTVNSHKRLRKETFSGAF